MAHDSLIENPQISTPLETGVSSRALSELRSVTIALVLGGVVAFLVAFALGVLLPASVVLDNNDLRRAPNDVLYDPIDFTYGVFPLETLPDGTTYNRTGGQAFFTYPYIANMGNRIQVSARLASDPVAGGLPMSCTLLLNGAPVAQYLASPEFSTIEATLDSRTSPNLYLDPAHLQVEIRSDSRLDAAGHNIGAAIDWIKVESVRDTGEVVAEGAIWAVVLVLVTLLTTFRLGVRRAYVAGLGLLATMVIVRVTYIPRAIPPWLEIVLIGVAWGLATWLTPRMGRWSWLWVLPLVMGLVWLLVAGRVLGDWQMDDAYISYRYAWNFTHGQGLVYNPGEIVEGYTNFLWTILSSVVIGLGLHPAGPMLAVNIALAMVVVALAWRLAKQLTGSYLWAGIAALLLCVDGGLVTYGARGSGMEAILFGFFVLLALAALWKDSARRAILWHVIGGVSLALGALTRPEGLLVAAVLIGVKLWQDYAGRTQKRNIQTKAAIASVAAFLSIVVPYEAWRILFYGWPFPNTFYAKTGTTLSLVERGLVYTGYFVTERWFVIVMAIIAGILVLGGRKLARHGMVPAIAVLLIIWIGYVLWAGGDYFPGWRFYVPVLAPLVLVAVWSTHKLLLKISQMGRAGVVALAIVAIIIPLYSWRAMWQQEPDGFLAQYTKIHTSYVNLWGSAGLWLRDNTPADSVTAAEGAGALAYFSERRVVDMFGLNDLHIGHLPVDNMGAGKAGHEKRDPVYVLNAKKPAYIYAMWASYFDSISDQLERDYDSVLYRSPTGTKIEWLVRKDVK